MAKRLFSGLVGVVVAIVFFYMFGSEYGAVLTAVLAGLLCVVSGVGMRLLLGADRIIVDDAHMGLMAEQNWRKPAQGGMRKPGIR